MPENYPAQRSKVSVTFKDTGEVKEYTISAGPGISPYLCSQAGDTGFLVLMDGTEAHSIPVENILEWGMELIPEKAE